MTEISSALMQEHQLILKTNQLMNKAASLSKNENNPFPILEVGRPFIDFIRFFADRFHHAKEEEILFKFLNLDGVLEHCNPIPQMLHEHDLGRALVKRMQEAIGNQDRGEFIDAMLTYTNLLSDHIYKEDNILYPMAENSLSEAQKTSICEAYQETEKRLDAQEIWRKHREFSSKLEQKLQAAKN
jgi:hemerythrin-like domain-containing protein